MSHAKILLRALPNVEFVHGFPGIPAGPDRPQATIRGAVEVRLGNQPVKAKWVKVELRKIETIPGPGNRGEEFVDLVGQNPITLWEAKDENETLSSKDFPFNIRVPETIPPSVALERGAGIKYEVVATLSTKGKKGLLRRETSTPISHSVPVVIDKHELHSTWPIYAQPETRHVVSNGLTLAVDRSHTCYAPGDRLSIVATLKSDNLSPVVLRGFEFSLKETVIYRAGPQSHGKKNGPLVQTSVLGEQKLPVSMTLYGGTQHKGELACIIPGNHTTSSVNAGRHIDIGYSLNIKAIIDLTNPVVMDLPVTITNWPRHVSAEMIRRIGTAPNLSLKPAMVQKPFTASLVHPLDSRSKYGPPHPPPSGGLPNIPNGEGGRTSPPGARVSVTLGSPNLGQSASSMNPYSFQQITYSTTTAGQASSLLTAVPEAAIAATSSDALATSNPGDADEFGYNHQSNTGVATVPLRQGESQGLGATDAKQRASYANHRTVNSQSTSGLDNGGSNRVSQYSQDSDGSGNTGTKPASTTGRRARGMSRTLKIMNVPEEESPVKAEASPKHFERTMQSASPPGSLSSASPWPTAEDEKKRLYETARAKAEQLYRITNDASSQAQAPRPSNGHASPPRQASPASIDQTARGDRPSIALTAPQTPWPTAEDEKQRLFERAQAKARRAQPHLDVTPPPSNTVAIPAATPTTSPSASTTRPGHSRSVSSNSSQDSHSNRALAPYASNAIPTMSAGAALYLHAISSINRPTSNMYTPATTSSAPRRTLSASSGNTGPSSKTPPPSRPVISTEEDKSALRYYEARSAVQRQQQQAGNSIPEASPQEGPIPYDELFGARSDAAPSGPSANGASPPLSEKEVIRRAFEARDAQAAASSSPYPAAVPPVAVHRSLSERTIPPLSPSAGHSEKETLRKAFEARDVAMIRSGQAPPLSSVPPSSTPPPPTPPIPPVQYSQSVAATTPLQPTPSAIPPVPYSPPARSLSLSGGPSSSNGRPAPNTALSEKEQMRRAFEARDRVIAAQQSPPPPDYDLPPPSLPATEPSPSGWSGRNGGPLSAAEEKSQLEARYAAADAGSAEAGLPPQSPSFLEATTTPQYETFESPSPPIRTQSHRSQKSDNSDTILRRDPSISAGKKRASQMIALAPTLPPPPPLPPRPPAEYIEETKLEDKRNTLETTLALPPSDFSSSFDLGFDSFSIEHSEHRSD